MEALLRIWVFLDIILFNYCNSPLNKLCCIFQLSKLVFRDKTNYLKIFVNPVLFVPFETCEVWSYLLWHQVFCFILFTVRKAVMCQDRAMVGILRPWLRLCRSTMIPSTQCILPESLRKRTQPIWHPHAASNVSNAYCLYRATLTSDGLLPAARNSCTESILRSTVWCINKIEPFFKSNRYS